MLQGAIFPHPGQQRLPVLELEHHLRPLEILQLPPILQRQCSANTGRSPKHPHQKGNSINGACSSFSIAVLHYFFIFVSLFLEISSHSVVHYQTLKLTMYPKKVSNSRHYPISNAGITGVNHYTWFSCSSFELVPETLESIWYLSQHRRHMILFLTYSLRKHISQSLFSGSVEHPLSGSTKSELESQAISMMQIQDFEAFRILDFHIRNSQKCTYKNTETLNIKNKTKPPAPRGGISP